MYDISLITNLIRETEIISLTPNFFNALEPLIDDCVGLELRNNITEFNESGIREHNNSFSNKLSAAYDLVEKYLGKKIKTMTFHLDVKERGLLDKLRAFNMSDPFLNISDLEKFHDDLKWLLDNEEYWTQSIPARSSKDYDNFVTECKMLAYATEGNYQRLRASIPEYDFYHTENLMHVLSRNSGFFYSQQEKQRDTGMCWIIMHADDLREVMYGIEFINYCHDNKISVSQKRRLEF